MFAFGLIICKTELHLALCPQIVYFEFNVAWLERDKISLPKTTYLQAELFCHSLVRILLLCVLSVCCWCIKTPPTPGSHNLSLSASGLFYSWAAEGFFRSPRTFPLACRFPAAGVGITERCGLEIIVRCCLRGCTVFPLLRRPEPGLKTASPAVTPHSGQQGSLSPPQPPF